MSEKSKEIIENRGKARKLRDFGEFEKLTKEFRKKQKTIQKIQSTRRINQGPARKRQMAGNKRTEIKIQPPTLPQ